MAADPSRNLLLIIVRDGIVTLCAFVRQAVDFISTEQFQGEQHGPEYLLGFLAEQISSVIQFYDLEVTGIQKEWEVVVVAEDPDALPQAAEEHLAEQTRCQKMHVWGSRQAFEQAMPTDSSILASAGEQQGPSVAAVGLAMGLLETTANRPCINLLPAEVLQKRSLKRFALVAANVVAVVMVLMATVGTVPSRIAGRIRAEATRDSEQLAGDTVTLAKRRQAIQRQIKAVSKEVQQLNKMLSYGGAIDWAGLLEEIRRIIPESVRISKVSCDTGRKLRIEGQALSNEDAYLFADLLDRSDYTTGASISTEKSEKRPELTNYEIECSVAAER